MILKDIGFGLFYICASFFAANLYTRIRTTDTNILYAVLMSQLFMLGSLAMLRWSDLSLVKQSALITLTSRFGYLLGLVYVGEYITMTQWVGIFVMVVGSFLTNK
jgi:threonine/homoserine efflux transporter RhtA